MSILRGSVHSRSSVFSRNSVLFRNSAIAICNNFIMIRQRQGILSGDVTLSSQTRVSAGDRSSTDP